MGVPLRRHGSSHNKGQKSTGTTSPVQCLCPIRRLSKEEFQDVVQQQKDGIFTISDAERRGSQMKILRPGPSEVQLVDSYMDAESPNPNSRLFKVLHQEKTAKLWNHAFKEHSQKFPDCDGSLDWNQHGEEKRGLAWILSIRCKKCHYTSHREKLYEEVSRSGRGRRAAQFNVAMAVGHLGTSLTTEGMRGMLLCANIEPASATNIHQTCNKVGKIITDVSKNSMKKIRQDIQELNEKCGLANTPIRAEGDARYNNATFSAIGKTPFQAATQVTYTLSENVTKKNNVVAVFCGNKLCKKGTHLRAKGKEFTCPGHEGCTATIPPETTIGDEKRWAAECISELQSDDRPLIISHFTSDGDSAAASGASLMKRAMSTAVRSIISCYQGQCGKSCQLHSFSCRGSIGVMEIQHWNFVNL